MKIKSLLPPFTVLVLSIVGYLIFKVIAYELGLDYPYGSSRLPELINMIANTLFGLLVTFSLLWMGLLMLSVHGRSIK